MLLQWHVHVQVLNGVFIILNFFMQYLIQLALSHICGMPGMVDFSRFGARPLNL